MEACGFYLSEQVNFLNSITVLEKQVVEENCRFLDLKKGEVIFFEEEKLEQLYCICQGVCKFSVIDVNGKEHITELLGKGKLMGRRSIISNKGALVNATAITDIKLCLLAKKVFLKNLNTNNDFCQDVLKGFVTDKGNEIKKITYYQNHLTVNKRLAGLLLYLSKTFGVDKQGWNNVSLKRQDMANILGTTSEYIISLLSALKEKDFLNINRGKIRIKSDKALMAFINKK